MKPKYGVSLPMLAIAALVAAGTRQSTADPAERWEKETPAQDTTPVKVVDERQPWRLRLHNVRPRTMAWWIDPAHNPEPIEITGSNTPLFNSRGDLIRGATDRHFHFPARPEKVFKLPEGIDQIIAVDPQYALLVYGTEEGVRRLQTIVNFLDKPIQQIEIEVQFVELIDQAAYKAFGIDWSGASNGPFSTQGLAAGPAPGAFSIGYVRGNLQAALKAMVAQGKAKIIASPRVTALNNLTASLYTTTSIPVVVGLKDDKGNFRELRKPATAATSDSSSFYLTTRIGFTVTPTINNDDTITVVLQPEPTVHLTVANDKHQSLPLATQNVQTIANVRDGDTIVLGGLSTQMMKTENLFVKDEDNVAVKQGGNMLLFVTARIVRRVEEPKAATPGNP